MLKQLFEVIRSAFLLSHDLQQNRREIEEVRRDLSQLEDRLHQMALMIQHERSEREKLVLQLENMLLRGGRNLPEPKSKRSKKKGG